MISRAIEAADDTVAGAIWHLVQCWLVGMIVGVVAGPAPW